MQGRGKKFSLFVVLKKVISGGSGYYQAGGWSKADGNDLLLSSCCCTRVRNVHSIAVRSVSSASSRSTCVFV